MCTLCAAQAQTVTSALWGTNGNNWDPENGPLQDFTNIGYMYGNEEIPDWPIGIDVTQPPYNAVPDDDVDDSQAIIDAIAACPPEHAVYLPKGRYIMLQRIHFDKDNVVLQGEDMYETVLFYPKNTNEIYIEEAGYENPDYFSPGNGIRNVGSEPFIIIDGGTHRSIENLTIEFREQTKRGHWEHKGNDAISHRGQHSWIRNVCIRNADHAIATSGGEYLSIVNIVMDQFHNRNKVRTEQEGSTVGHMAFNLNDTKYNLFHNIVITGHWSHEFDSKSNSWNVVSDVTSKDGVIVYHGMGSKDNLYTNFTTDSDYVGRPTGSTQFREVYWGMSSTSGDINASDFDYVISGDGNQNGHVLVGLEIDPSVIDTQSTPTLWYEAIDPAVLSPKNIYKAQLAFRGKPVPSSPDLQIPSPYTGDVIRIRAVEDNNVDSGNPSQTVNPEAGTLELGENPYIKFDLHELDLNSIHRVRLRLSSNKIANTPVAYALYAVENDAWSEETLNDVNKPDRGSELGRFQFNEDRIAAYVDLDVTAFVQSEWAGNKVVSFNIGKLSGNGFLSTITSTTNGYAPELIIEQVPAAVPGAPVAPAGVRANSLVGNIALDWDDNPESDVVTYNVYRSTISADFTQYDFPIGMGLTTSDFVDIQDDHDGGWDIGMVRDDIMYYYRVTAVDEHGYESEASAELVASAIGWENNTQPPAFTDSVIELDDTTQFLVYSESIAGYASDPDGDPVFFSKVSGPDWLTVHADGTLSGTPRLGDTGLYQIQVQASSLGGGQDEATFELRVNPGAPDAPVVLDIVPGDASVSLDWAHDTEGTSGYSFTVYQSTTAGGPYVERASGLAASTFTDTGLSNGTTVYYVVTASNGVGESPVSEERSATPVAGLALGTLFIGPDVITDAASWDNGLPAGQWGRIHQNATFDASIALDGYSVIHTGGVLSQNGISGLNLENGSEWVMQGPNAESSGSFRGVRVKSGSSFTLDEGVLNESSNTAWSLNDAGSRIIVNGGTIHMGKKLLLGGSAGPTFTINNGVIDGTAYNGVIGANRFANNVKTLNFNGGTTIVDRIDLEGDNTTLNVGGTSAGLLQANTLLEVGVGSTINFLPGSQMAVTLTAENEWASVLWAAGGLTYNGQGVSVLGSWSTVTSPGGLGGGAHFVYDSTTETLTLVSQAANQAPVFIEDPIGGVEATEGVAYSDSIAGSATDGDDDELFYSLVTSGTWLNVSSSGVLSGTPSSTDVGPNSFTVSVSDGKGGAATAVLNILVSEATTGPTTFTNASPADSLISNSGNWSNGLPVGGTQGTLTSDAVADSSLTLAGYSVLHTDGALTKTGFGSTKFGEGTVWEMNGPNARIEETRGLNLTGATFILRDGVADLTQNSKDTLLNEASEIQLHDGTLAVGRNLLFNGGDLTVDGGVLNIADGFGSRNFHNGGLVRLNAGTITAKHLTFGKETFDVTLGGSTAGTLTIENFGGGRANVDHIDINFESGTLMSVQLTNPVESGASGDGDLGWSKVGAETGLSWAEALWESGRLTYNEQDHTSLGAWSVVTTAGFGDGNMFVYDAGTATLSVSAYVPQNLPPVVSFMTPTQGESVPVGTDLYVFVDASDPDGSIAELNLYLNGQFVRRERFVPYEWGLGSQNDVLLQDMEVGTYTLTVIAEDTEGATTQTEITISVDPVAPEIQTETAGNITTDSADVGFTVVDDGGQTPTVFLFYGENDGGTVPANWSNSQNLGALGTGSYAVTLNGLDEGTAYSYSVQAYNSSGQDWGTTRSFLTENAGPALTTGLISDVGSAWQTFTMSRTYSSPVVVASVVMDTAAQLPAIARVRNASGDSFELKVQNPSGQVLSGYDVHIVVVEEGVYTAAEHGVTMEALRLTSTGTNNKWNWSNSLMEQLTPVNSYISPVVLGQVMSDNDAEVSVFWSNDGYRGNPATASSIYVGKHVAENSNNLLADETLGVIVLESGNATLDGVAFTAGVGANTVRGIGNAPAYPYGLTGLTSASHAAVSSAGMNGGDGGWPVLFGPTPVTSSTLNLAFDEDQINDDERGHTSEEVAYLVFE